MSSERLDYDDAYTTRFMARVAGRGEHAGRPALELDSTYFYPESGGQEADRGLLGGTAVTDVQVDEQGRVWHVFDPSVPEPAGEVPASIDWARRFDHMQQHTGQHVLSAAFERELRGATVSSRLGPERSTVDIDLREADWGMVQRIEEISNAVIWEDRPIERHWVDAEGVKRFALRKPPAVTGRIRIVEIPDWDVSACGGTHTRRTGEVGVIKVVRWEKVRGNVRFEFLCGGRALRDYAWRTESLLEAARRRTLLDRELLPHLERAAAERDELKKRLAELNDRLLEAEVREKVGNPPRPVTEWFANRPRAELRSFVIRSLESGAPWAVAAAGAPEPVVIAGRAKAGTFDLRGLLPGLIERSGGKGGGSPDLVQVAAADAGAAEAAMKWTALSIESAVQA